MAEKPDLADYKDVNVRIREFYAKYPDGRLTKHGDDTIVMMPGPDGEAPRPFVKYTAAAYRTPEDPHPGIGTAWEPFPGRTPYTRDSELMNAETAAWGRAIVACGIIAKNESIASRQEIQSRSAEHVPPPAPKVQGPTLAQRIAMACKDLGWTTKQERDRIRVAVVGKADDLTDSQARCVLVALQDIKQGRLVVSEPRDGEWFLSAGDAANPSQVEQEATRFYAREVTVEEK